MTDLLLDSTSLSSSSPLRLLQLLSTKLKWFWLCGVFLFVFVILGCGGGVFLCSSSSAFVPLLAKGSL